MKKLSTFLLIAITCSFAACSKKQKETKDEISMAPKIELEDFFKNLIIGCEPKPTGNDGLEVIKMIEAIYKSNQKRVKI